MTVTLPELERVDPPVAVAIILRVLEQLENAHADGPRASLCPAEVWIDAYGRVALGPRSPAADLRYVAPEHANGVEIDTRADLYVVGVMLWELLTGQPHLVAASVSEAEVLARSPRPSTPPSTHTADIPRALDGALHALLAVQPRGRPKTAGEARHRLAAALPGALRVTDATIGALAANAEARHVRLGAATPTPLLSAAMVEPTFLDPPASGDAMRSRRDARLITTFVVASAVIVLILAWIVVA